MAEKRLLSFVLPFALPSLNVSLRQHWAERGRDQKMLHMEILAAFGPRYWPHPPFERAKVIVTRYSTRQLDVDNLSASVKALVDLMKTRSERNPLGLGWIIDDGPERCEMYMLQDTSAATRTAVTVEELDYVPPPPKPARKPGKPRRYPPKRASARAVAQGVFRNRP